MDPLPRPLDIGLLFEPLLFEHSVPLLADELGLISPGDFFDSVPDVELSSSFEEEVDVDIVVLIFFSSEDLSSSAR